MSVLSLYY